MYLFYSRAICSLLWRFILLSLLPLLYVLLQKICIYTRLTCSTFFSLTSGCGCALFTTIPFLRHNNKHYIQHAKNVKWGYWFNEVTAKTMSIEGLELRHWANFVICNLYGWYSKNITAHIRRKIKYFCSDTAST